MEFFINQQHCLPALKTRIAIDLVGDLVCQDLKRFGAGHKSRFVYHHARRMIGSSLAATGLVWLAVPVFLEPEYVLMPGVVGMGLAISIAVGAFKKHV
ncbi:DUF4400 domain-containing protein [Citrobacter freundii]|uniref:DUF4400 domain-containing protein n=1 Tax=Citrobacter sp. Cf132 TaxID=2985077 RepID=UPI0009ED8576|nr:MULTISPECIES: DUF4400 domain-containing protein [Citrobacter]EJR7283350.1 DUF4400 domain-containing protein [Citrobacter freundii]EKT9243726.1 DUF4400 domain-containing protein [Citrobacter freundii]EKW8511799.1 DUF4400 domain-containing protein [Citrobacter freundii]EMB4320709.1 DUF4400 domain-containing protein [Citrobacter freundii]MDM3106864.1 DUF4400 domain-containing protein [Citrobacter sp. Cf132]